MDVSIDIHTDEDTKFVVSRSIYSTGESYHTIKLTQNTSFPSAAMYFDRTDLVRLRDVIAAHLDATE